MIKRLILIGLLAFTLVPLSRTKANACEPSLLALYGICFEMDISDFSIFWGSVDVDSVLKKLKNADTTAPSYETVLFIQGFTARCKNPGGQTKVLNNGKPFNVNATLNDTQAIQAGQIAKNGSFLSEISFSNQDIIDAVEAALATNLDSLCKQNGNPWTLDKDKIAVTSLQLVGTLFTCANGGNPDDPRGLLNPLNACKYTSGTAQFLFPGGLAIQDSLGKQCTVPKGQDPLKAPFTYACGTACSGTVAIGASDPCPQTLTGPGPFPII